MFFILSSLLIQHPFQFQAGSEAAEESAVARHVLRKGLAGGGGGVGKNPVLQKSLQGFPLLPQKTPLCRSAPRKRKRKLSSVPCAARKVMSARLPGSSASAAAHCIEKWKNTILQNSIWHASCFISSKVCHSRNTMTQHEEEQHEKLGKNLSGKALHA